MTDLQRSKIVIKIIDEQLIMLKKICCFKAGSNANIKKIKVRKKSKKKEKYKPTKKSKYLTITF